MSDQPGLGLAFDAGDVPAEMFDLPDDDARMNSETADEKFPIEYPAPNISLRMIERGVWLWGLTWDSPLSHAGGGFAPFRKWGVKHAAMSREAAIGAARMYLAEKMGG